MEDRLKPITIELFSEEGNSGVVPKNLLDELKTTFNTLLENLQLSIGGITDELIDKCAGYVLEECIKLNIKDISSPDIKDHFKFIDNKWYDFKYDNNPIKIISFKEGEQYSSTMLSASQYENRENLIFISIIYSINDNSISISDILVTRGYKVKVKYDRVVYSSVIKPVIIPEPEDETMTALKLIFKSNLIGDVQILNL